MGCHGGVCRGASGRDWLGLHYLLAEVVLQRRVRREVADIEHRLFIKRGSLAVFPRSTARTIQPSELSRVVNQEQIARVVKIFSYKLTAFKLELEYVIASHIGGERLTVT